ncbi:Predicted periplasmic/secreted protein [Yersinia pseudotuberculosis]|nr:Predicted periplasmic/secreted protein [Yersinia pseudotuberculosis]CNB22132.1 Predicted periplasmic/secreted protein [Yersinia pseudotuberculosis]CNB22875.1 Predicted periplasmic/secreted protein [Yersinia pseudotuberculosis]CRY58182.1 Predicted periplasmic/secreted protein [Yersinia pseudotuberculosis]SUB28784.1 Predicted periplasmic/secreted protein [Yersinia pseudotuberculosis]
MSEKRVNLQVIAWATIIGGFVSSLVKSGTEVNMPPRRVGKISPPAANIDAWLGWLGINSHSMDYVYQGVTISGAVVLYHWLFSLVLLLFMSYCPPIGPKSDDGIAQPMD